MSNLKLAIATIAAILGLFIVVPMASAAEQTETEIRGKVKCNWDFEDCQGSISGSHSQTKTYGDRSETVTIEIEGDKDGPSIEGGHKSSQDDHD